MEGNKDKGEEWESSKIMDMLIINSVNIYSSLSILLIF